MQWPVVPHCLLSLNTDQALHFVTPDLDANVFYKLSADNWQTKSQGVIITYTVKPVLSGLSKRRSKIGFQECRSKVLQNAPRGAFCNTFDLH